MSTQKFWIAVLASCLVWEELRLFEISRKKGRLQFERDWALASLEYITSEMQRKEVSLDEFDWIVLSNMRPPGY